MVSALQEAAKWCARREHVACTRHVSLHAAPRSPWVPPIDVTSPILINLHTARPKNYERDAARARRRVAHNGANSGYLSASSRKSGRSCDSMIFHCARTRIVNSDAARVRSLLHGAWAAAALWLAALAVPWANQDIPRLPAAQ